jgi:hypothetical protein
MEDNSALAKIYSGINTLNEIQALIGIFDIVPCDGPYTSKALNNMNREMNCYHNNLKKATEVIQQLEPVMQKYRAIGYSIICEPKEYYERSEWMFHLKYSIIRDSTIFVVNLYIKDAKTNAVETVVGLSYRFKENGGTYSNSYTTTVSKMSMAIFMKSIAKYDVLIHDVCALFDKYPLNSVNNAKLFVPEFKALKIAKK